MDNIDSAWHDPSKTGSGLQADPGELPEAPGAHRMGQTLQHPQLELELALLRH